MAHKHSPEITYENTNEIHQQDLLVIPNKLISTVENFEKRDNSWFAISDLPSDLSIKVETSHFTFTSFLCFRGAVIWARSISGLQSQRRMTNSNYKTFPADPRRLKPCSNSATASPPLGARRVPRHDRRSRGRKPRIEKPNPSSLGRLSSWKDSITVLKSVRNPLPVGENLQIVRKCCDSIARAPEIEHDRWKHDVSGLRIDHFVKIITSMILKGLRPDFLGSYIMIYAERWLIRTDGEIEGLKRYRTGKEELKWRIQKGRNQETGSTDIIERLVSILPREKEGISCKFLLWMLKMAMVYGVSPALVSELEKRVGMVMEDASVYDLLIPGYTGGEEGNQLKSSGERTVFNVDVVQRILEYYLMHEQQQQQTQSHGKLRIGKLLDNYLAEIAGDPNLSVTKFQVIAESLPDNARPCDDGLYRAIDIYLKAHPALSKHDKRRLCRTMDCQKLSIDACTHAAQNDRLSLRTVIQVLFAEQLKLRATMHKNPQATNNDNLDQEDYNCSFPKEEIKMLKAEVGKIMVVMEDLQKDYKNLHQYCEKMTKKHNALSGWILGWNKLKKSTLFPGKLDSKENREGREKEKRISSILRLKRRQSIS
ncbi:hypothetical protein OSB04_000580 [Centaurea solstitialis]|uniref:NPH3 domain-containing protein n=1 Tax=Centaurea solstitialis TaxID=347529 RepID=A0AA38TPJ4_9ASTR|nr:hypothetical protein OSB04_000580 [Centaurea solstitialis]